MGISEKDISEKAVQTIKLGIIKKHTILEPMQDRVLELSSIKDVMASGSEDSRPYNNLTDCTSPTVEEYLSLPKVKALYMDDTDVRISRLILVKVEGIEGTKAEGYDNLKLVLEDSLVSVQLLLSHEEYKISYVVSEVAGTRVTLRVLIEYKQRLVVCSYTYDILSRYRSLDSVFEYPLAGIRVQENHEETEVYFGEGNTKETLLFKYATGTESSLTTVVFDETER